MEENFKPYQFYLSDTIQDLLPNYDLVSDFYRWYYSNRYVFSDWDDFYVVMLYYFCYNFLNTYSDYKFEEEFINDVKLDYDENYENFVTEVLANAELCGYEFDLESLTKSYIEITNLRQLGE